MEGKEEHQRHPTKICAHCGVAVTKAGYAKRQWRREQPICLACNEESEAVDNPPTKQCSQCNEERDKDQFPKKQWKREHPLCRLCFEITSISDEQTRKCRECKLVLPRNQFNIHQWGKGADALCHKCRGTTTEKIFASIGTDKGTKDLPDGTMLCSHSLEWCDDCMVDYTLPNQFARKRASLGRDLTNDETEEISNAFMESMNINRKICILDGQPMCPRSGRKLRCPCNEVTYCSQACQKHHWVIHKMTCKVHTKAKKEKAEKKKQSVAHSAAEQPPSHGLSEEQLNNIRIEAFFAENSGDEHAIEECAWQLGEHPFVIGGGSVTFGRDGTQEFVKGDVAKIYMEMKGVVWDGSPRFGMGPYVQKKTPFDWIAKARQGNSENFLRGQMMKAAMHHA